MGLDVDLANAIAEVIGVDVEFVNLGFDPLIPSLKGGEIDIVMSSMTITATPAGDGLHRLLHRRYGHPGEERKPRGHRQVLEGLCGLIAAVQVGTIQVDQLEALNDETCTD